jgi:hypothetical protein
MKRFIIITAVLFLTATGSFSQLLKQANDNELKKSAGKPVKSNFIENKGQWNQDAIFLTKSGGLNAWITHSGIVYDFYRIENTNDKSRLQETLQSETTHRYGHVVYMKFSGKVPHATYGSERKETRYNYFLGNDPSKWAENVPLFNGVIAENICPGISARYYYDNEGLRYDLVLSPGVDISQLELSFEGSNGISVNKQGELIINTVLGDVFQKKLFAYQDNNGQKSEVACRFVINQEGRVGFSTKWYDKSRPLIIDPLVYSTFIGSSELDQINDIAQDASGVVITGKTSASEYPATSGAYDVSYNGSTDAFISKLNAGGTDLIFSTFIGGSANDEGNGIAIGSNSVIYFAGTSSSYNFPVTSGVYDETFNHTSDLWYDCVVAKLSATGNALTWSTYLGGSAGSDFSSKIAVDAQGKPTVMGYTFSNDFPMSSGCYDNSFNGLSDVFISKLSSNGNAIALSTFVGGNNSDIGNDLFQDQTGNVYVTGTTSSSNFPTTVGAFDESFNDLEDAFIFKLNAIATSLVYSTFLGGNDKDSGNGIVIDGNGNACVTGSTKSSNFPVTTGSFNTSHSNTSYHDAYVTKIAASGSALVYSTFIGGYDEDVGNAIAIDGSGNAIMTGYTESSDFPMVSYSYDNSNNGSEDVIVAKLNSGGSGLIYSTYIGGMDSDKGTGLVNESGNTVIIAGNTASVNYPVTTGAYDVSFNDLYYSSDGFVTKLQFASLPQVTVTSSGNISCFGGNNGFISITVTAGITPYTFLWNNNSTSEDINNITAGTYTVTVTDLVGASVTASTVLTQPAALSTSAVITNANCSGCPNGAIDLSVNGGISPYSYLWSNTAVTQDLVNIVPGTYKVTVTDSNNCTATVSYNVSVFYQLQATVGKTDVSCNGGSNGSINLTLINGTAPFSYQWSNGATTEDINNLTAGSYSVTVTDYLNFTTTASAIISQPAAMTLSGTVTNVSCNGCSNGAVSLTVSGGTSPYFYNWSNGTTSSVLSSVPVGNYQVTVTDVNSCGITSAFTILLVYQPNWSYSITSTNHSILIQSSTSITINYVPVESGDYLGVFYDVSGTLYCGGFIIWQGQTSSIAAWGDDAQTTIKDGFSSGEAFNWKIFDTSTGLEYTASATYATGYPNTGTYANNGMSVVTGLNTSVTQNINLPNNWSIFSTYIVPQNLNISNVLSPIVSSVIIAKAENGNVYWPPYGVNNIGDMVTGKGYQLKLTSAQVLAVNGMAVVPEATPLTIPSGWGILGYLRTSQASIVTLMSPVINNIIIMKDGDGNAYWPEYGVNQIGNMTPGKGYQMKAGASFTYTYPAN